MTADRHDHGDRLLHGARAVGKSPGGSGGRHLVTGNHPARMPDRSTRVRGTPSEVLARRLAGPVVLPAELPVPWKLVLTGMLTHRPDQRLEDFQVAALLATRCLRRPMVPPDGDVTINLGATRERRQHGDDAGRRWAVAGRHRGRRDARHTPTRTDRCDQETLQMELTGAGGIRCRRSGWASDFSLLLGSKPAKSPTHDHFRPPTTTTTVLAGTAALNALKSQVLAGEPRATSTPRQDRRSRSRRDLRKPITPRERRSRPPAIFNSSPAPSPVESRITPSDPSKANCCRVTSAPRERAQPEFGGYDHHHFQHLDHDHYHDIAISGQRERQRQRQRKRQRPLEILIR
jgi:hypothetical protein